MLTIILVLYQTKLKNAVSLVSLVDWLAEIEPAELVTIVLYDNGQENQEKEAKQIRPIEKVRVIYQHNPQNPGLAVAYNQGLAVANEADESWLMLLDQDTVLTKSYLQEAFDLMKEPERQIILPQIVNPKTNHALSPHDLTNGQSTLPAGHYEKCRVMAINSGAILKTTILNQLGGFNLDYPLDYLDHWLFHQLSLLEIPVDVLTSQLAHELSVTDLKTVNNQRYANILYYEKKFIQEYHPKTLGSYYGHSILRLLKCLVVDPSKIKIIVKTMFVNTKKIR